MELAALPPTAAVEGWLPGGQLVVLIILLLQGSCSRQRKDPVVCVLGIDIATLLNRRWELLPTTISTNLSFFSAFHASLPLMPTRPRCLMHWA